MIFKNIVHSKIHIIFFVSENIYFCTYKLYVNLKIMSNFYILSLSSEKGLSDVIFLFF